MLHKSTNNKQEITRFQNSHIEPIKKNVDFLYKKNLLYIYIYITYYLYTYIYLVLMFDVFDSFLLARQISKILRTLAPYQSVQLNGERCQIQV